MSDIRGRWPCSAPIRRTEMALDPLTRTTATKRTRSPSEGVRFVSEERVGRLATDPGNGCGDRRLRCRPHRAPRVRAAPEQGRQKPAKVRDWAASARGPEPVDFDGRRVVYSANPVRRGLMHDDVARGSTFTSGGPNAPAVVVAARSAGLGAIHDALRALAADAPGPPGGVAREDPFRAGMSWLGRPSAAGHTTGAPVTIRGSPVDAQDAREFGGGRRERGGRPG